MRHRYTVTLILFAVIQLVFWSAVLARSLPGAVPVLAQEPTPTEKPPAPPTPTPLPPPATPVPPTNTPQPTQADGSGAPPATPTATATLGGPTATRGAALPSPTATVTSALSGGPAGAVVEGPTATATARPPEGTVGYSESVSVGESEGWHTSGETGGLGGWLRSLPPWGPWAAGLALLAVVAFGTWLVTRFVHYTGRDLQVKQRMIAESESSRLEERRREVEALLVAQNDWLRVTSQAGADALGRAVQLDPQVPPRVSGKPAPYFTVTGIEGTRYVFTTDVKALQQVGLLKRKVRPARLPSPVEAAQVWRYLAEKWLREAGEAIPAVPRDAAWFLVVVAE